MVCGRRRYGSKWSRVRERRCAIVGALQLLTLVELMHIQLLLCTLRDKYLFFAMPLSEAVDLLVVCGFSQLQLLLLLYWLVIIIAIWLCIIFASNVVRIAIISARSVAFIAVAISKWKIGIVVTLGTRRIVNRCLAAVFVRFAQHHFCVFHINAIRFCMFCRRFGSCSGTTIHATVAFVGSGRWQRWFRITFYVIPIAELLLLFHIFGAYRRRWTGQWWSRRQLWRHFNVWPIDATPVLIVHVNRLSTLWLQHTFVEVGKGVRRRLTIVQTNCVRVGQFQRFQRVIVFVQWIVTGVRIFAETFIICERNEKREQRNEDNGISFDTICG